MSFFFGKNEWETSLTQAVICDDIQAVKELSLKQEECQASNYLGFNGVELARYLNRKECLSCLHPAPFPQFKVFPKNSSSPVFLDPKGFEDLFHARYLPYLRFDHYELFKKAIQACPWTTAGGDRKEEMEGRFQRHQEALIRGYTGETSIRWIDERLGYGLFAERPFDAGEFIGEYCGEMHPRNIIFLTDNVYCFQYTSGLLPFFFLTINAKYAGNELRFANHSYAPNMLFKAALDRGVMHVLFYTQKKVKQGEQLTYDYGEDYWAKRGPPVDL